MTIQTFDCPLPHGITLSERAAGQPGRPVLLFLHGFPEAAFVWDEALRHFAAAEHGGWRCIAPNLRGYERSSAPTDPQAYRATQPGPRHRRPYRHRHGRQSHAGSGGRTRGARLGRRRSVKSGRHPAAAATTAGHPELPPTRAPSGAICGTAPRSKPPAPTCTAWCAQTWHEHQLPPNHQRPYHELPGAPRRDTAPKEGLHDHRERAQRKAHGAQRP